MTVALNPSDLAENYFGVVKRVCRSAKVTDDRRRRLRALFISGDMRRERVSIELTQRQDIADYLGVTIETLNHLHDFQMSAASR